MREKQFDVTLPPGGPERLLSPEAMRSLVRRERLRSDRSGSPLALVIFHLGEGSSFDDNARRLEATLLGRLRETDAAGLFEHGRVAMLLPDTPAAGALKVAEDVSRLFEPHPPGFDYELYVHPTEPMDHANGEGHTPAGLRPARVVHNLERLFNVSISRLKRLVDMVGSAAGLVVTAPLMLLIAAAIRLTSPGPVLFTQRRDGIGGRVFTIYKFRTMCLGADERQVELRKLSSQDGAAFKMVDDPRLTPIGRWLRKTSIDELPQLWNVLKGDMSLVGPRPLPCHESAACLPWQRRRLDVTPGLTGLWQVNGRSSVAFDDWIRMDLDYIARRGLWFDLQLLLRTIPAVVLRRGAH